MLDCEDMQPTLSNETSVGWLRGHATTFTEQYGSLAMRFRSGSRLASPVSDLLEGENVTLEHVAVVGAPAGAY
jgi:hypothetical protein